MAAGDTYVQQRRTLHTEHIVTEGMEPHKLRRLDLIETMRKPLSLRLLCWKPARWTWRSCHRGGFVLQPGYVRNRGSWHTGDRRLLRDPLQAQAEDKF